VESVPLPQHPLLRAFAERLEARRFVAEVWDARYRLSYLTRDYLRSAGATGEAAATLLGEPVYGERALAERQHWPGFATTDSWHASLIRLLPAVAHDVPGGIDELKAELAPELSAGLDGLVPRRGDSLTLDEGEIKFGRRTTPFWSIGTRLYDAAGAFAGVVVIVIPAVSGSTLSLLATGDHRSLERLLDIVRPARRGAAVLFADLERSSELARQLSAAEYCRLVRRLMTRMDDEIVKRAGIAGKHAGDGISALFIAEQHETESQAARACIEAARAISANARAVAQRSDLTSNDVSIRFGLHWGATLYVGSLLTSGRADATALGDEMNEAARIEGCASGGRTLASKALVERLTPEDLDELQLDSSRLRFTQLDDLQSATDKARRDAPALAVCDLTST
jgi:class 3 adenylate cyclase